MKMKKSTLFFTQSAVIAAAYTGLTYLAAVFGLAYGPIQFRFSEALTILPVFTPAAIPGLTIGCLLGNLGSNALPLDVIFGTFASFIAAVCSYYTRKVLWKRLPILATVFPVLINAVIVGFEICVYFTKDTSLIGFLTVAGQVGLGQLVVCYGLGMPLYTALKRVPFFAEGKMQ